MRDRFFGAFLRMLFVYFVVLFPLPFSSGARQLDIFLGFFNNDTLLR